MSVHARLTPKVGARMRRFVLINFLLFASLSGQTSTSGISGIVSDPSGAVVPGAKVTVANDDTGVAQHQLTTQSGVYSFPGLPVGSYTVVVEMKGFRTTRQPGNVLQVESPQTINIALEVGNSAD